MNALEALRTFLAGALIRRRDRYLGFVAKRKNRPKFLDAIYHDLGMDLDRTKKITRLPAGSTSIPGYRFAPPREFGTSISDIRKVCSSSEDTFLMVSEDGQYGIYGPETFLDDCTIYRVNPEDFQSDGGE